jgi:hypothetical protein
MQRRLTGLLAFLGILLIAIVLIISYIILSSNKIVVTVEPSSTTVITEIRYMAKVETVSYSLEKVIAYDQDANSIWHFLGDHKKLFVVHGDVIAGFDLSKITKDDIQIHGKSITLNMPPPQILVTTLDESKMRVYDSNTGVYGLWDEGIDANAELKVLAGAKQSLQDDACQEGILQKASESTRMHFTSFLTALGFTKITLNIPNGTC